MGETLGFVPSTPQSKLCKDESKKGRKKEMRDWRKKEMRDWIIFYILAIAGGQSWRIGGRNRWVVTMNANVLASRVLKEAARWNNSHKITPKE